MPWLLSSLATAWVSALALICLYIFCNDRSLRQIPATALQFAPIRVTPQNVLDTAKKLPISIQDQLPPATGRRYIVVGGAGFLGGWIVVYLLKRGEHPNRIRIIDLRPPTREDLTTGLAAEVQFLQVDITDAKAVDAAFSAPWPKSSSEPSPEITVIHTAANIRFYERHSKLVEKSAEVNIGGTQNIINASISIGASALVYTSSGSVSIHSQSFLLWPWQKEPKLFVQAINDDDELIPKQPHGFFSNYALTKSLAERRVRNSDKLPSGSGVLRTGCLRPGNGIFGPGGDMLCGAYLVRKTTPSWIQSIVSNFIYVENCALAHLCYEQRLIEIEQGKGPDIGGQAFSIVDPGPPPTYGDVYTVLSTLTDGETNFPVVSPTAMLLLAYLIEAYYLTRHFMLSAGIRLANFLPAISGDLINLQPSLWSLTMVHLIFDDSRARLPPDEGGLGYKGGWTTIEGVCKTVEEYKKGGIPTVPRSNSAGAGFGVAKAQNGVARVGEKVAEEIGIDPIKILSKP
ncbi:NAD-P-binding protein [Mycena floridula]|nr:NAD-P-binding protein [Mycena floridula]